MPYLDIKDLRIYYEIAGDPSAPALLILSGLTDYTEKCNWQVDDLSGDFFVITYDNRGAGRSTLSPPGYTMADLADDASSVLEALSIPKANVFGFSLGGMIALHLALNYPQRVERLVLGCTTAGGRLGVMPDDTVFSSLVQPVRTGDQRQDFFNGIRFSVSEQCMMEQPELLDALADIAISNPQTSEGYTGQIQAVLTHDVADRLGEIDIPTLVLHGDSDLMIPPENGRLLAENIAGAKYISYPEAGHLFFIEKAPSVNQDIRKFLSPKLTGIPAKI